MPPIRNDPFQRLGLDREVLTTSQLNQRARLLLEDVFPQIWVEGELSSLARPISGHIYFTLKDNNTRIRCALFRQNALRVRQALRDGLAVKVCGKILLFEGRGDYQLIIDAVEPVSDGALRLAFEASEEKLAGKNLFASERRHPLPTHPRHIGIVGLSSGAIIRDIIGVFRRRAPQVKLTLVPTAVQSRKVVVQIVHALQLADRQGFDALILTRDGGSLEDLWCFNEEAVTRAMAACTTSIVSAAGHETDVSISDFVADVRTPTPSTAIELLAPGASDLQQRLDGLYRRLVLHMRDQLLCERLRLGGIARRLCHPGERPCQQAQRLDDLDIRLHRASGHRLAVHHERLVRLETRLAAQHPGRILALLRQKLDSLAAHLSRVTREALRDRHQRPEGLAQTLSVVSLLATLDRGYGILLDERGRAIRDAGQTQPGQHLKARPAEGELEVRVEDNHRTPVTLSLLD